MRMAAAAPHAHREVRTHRWRRGARDRTARLRVGMNYAWEAREVILGRCEDPGFRRGRGGGGEGEGGGVWKLALLRNGRMGRWPALPVHCGAAASGTDAMVAASRGWAGLEGGHGEWNGGQHETNDEVGRRRHYGSWQGFAGDADAGAVVVLVSCSPPWVRSRGGGFAVTALLNREKKCYLVVGSSQASHRSWPQRRGEL